MDEIRASVRRKTMVLIAAALLFTVFCGAAGRFAAVHGHSFWFHKNLAKNLSAFDGEIEAFKPAMDNAARIGALMSNVKYESASGLRETLHKELSNIGFAVSEISVSPSKKKGLVDVSANGSVGANELGAFIKGLSTRPKIWGIAEMSISPAVSPASLVSQFVILHKRGDRRGVENFLSQGKMLLGEGSGAAMLFNVTIKLTVAAG